jgi:hypothetical protein
VATDIYVVGTEAEFDIGLAFPVGPLSLVLMAGPVFDFATMNLTNIVAPQLFTIYDGSVYFESWIQAFLPSILDSDAQDTLYTRNFLLFQASGALALGPQVEATINLGGDGDALVSLPAGLRFNVGYGENNTLGLFLGYEIQEVARLKDSDGIAGRFTFVRTW